MIVSPRLRFVAPSIIAASAVVFASSGCAGKGGDDDPAGIPPNPAVNDTTSYAYAKPDVHVGRQSLRAGGGGGFAHGVAYGDFDLDGDTDVVVAPGDGTTSPMPFEAYRNTGGTFAADLTLLSNTSGGTVHARKSIVGDYDGDGRPDVFVMDHGHDQPPFPGAPPVLLLSGSDGRLSPVSLPEFAGYNHAGASADVDADGDLDVFMSATPNGGGPWFLRNDGTGTFTRDVTMLPGSLAGKGIYTSELIDVDEDGFVDLLLAGHEQDGFRAQIRWGSPAGTYLGDVAVLPVVTDYGVVLDIDAEDIDGDGDRDLVLTRTGSTSFYAGYSLQVLVSDGARGFTDETATRVPGLPDAGGTWFDFIRLVDTDANGSVDILLDDRDRNLRWVNDGTGTFTATTVD